ncbi:phage baseplate assembly protein V [Paenibacillus sp. LHD-117]|uniref:phage baseplate assembly protein V n=1 Tax=Paenibacillus sp. LHD-117 TaxID=3071412 RepID=UPI0027DF9F57|nr:phage baseplate assembly protein V [Paenibacillus sp. LHD-117]MDQ6423034.1 phage baseplate assembly protein V [Paenibacillus sp. LHD-117]
MRNMYPGFFDPYQRSMPSEQLSGVWNAIVTNTKDPENLGRVKLKFPSREGELETDWVRVATLMGGSGKGSLFIPDVNDEVLVAFLMGRLDQPVVIGSLWSKQDKPPPGDTNNEIKKIKTKYGHEITFNDKESEGSITIKTKKGHSIILSDKDGSVKAESADKQHSLELDETGKKVTVKSGTSKVELTSSGNVTISGTQSLSVKAPEVKLEASASMSIKSTGMLDIKSDGMINIKGSMVKIN